MAEAKNRKPRTRGNRDAKPYQRASDGRWVAVAYPPKGSINAKPVPCYGKTRAEAVNKRKLKEEKLKKGIVGDTSVTVGQYFETWLTVTLGQYLRSGEMSEATVDSYRDNARLHILPSLAHLRIVDELTSSIVREWLDILLAKPSGRAPKKPKPGQAVSTLSHRTTAYCRAILHKAIEDAIRDEVVPGLERNVVDKVVPPKDRTKKKIPPTITPEEAAALLIAMSEDDLWCYWLIAFALGFRKGEGLGMRWVDLDRSNRIWSPQFQVRRHRGEPDPKTGRRKGKLVLAPLKTDASLQPIALPTWVVRALDMWEQRQVGKRAVAVRWADLGLVFTTSVGTAIDPRNLLRYWKRVCERAGITRSVPIHDLRHACASYLLHAGIDIKLVQRTLRQSRLETTMIYLHALVEAPLAAADAMDSILADLSPDEGRNALLSALLSPSDSNESEGQIDAE